MTSVRRAAAGIGESVSEKAGWARPLELEQVGHE